MKKKLKQLKQALKANKHLSEKELSFITGGAARAIAGPGSSGSHSGSSCDNTSVHCCVPDIEI